MMTNFEREFNELFFYILRMVLSRETFTVSHSQDLIEI